MIPCFVLNCICILLALFLCVGVDQAVKKLVDKLQEWEQLERLGLLACLAAHKQIELCFELAAVSI